LAHGTRAKSYSHMRDFMPTKHSTDVKFEIGHVLFVDIVGYSKLLITEQSECIQTLKETRVANTIGARRRCVRIDP
jgi:hypothetical protein